MVQERLGETCVHVAHGLVAAVAHVHVAMVVVGVIHPEDVQTSF